MIKKSVLAVIPARGGSKGIPRKNIRILGGKPLIEYTTSAVLASQGVDKVILTTDSIEIAKIGQDCGIEVPFIRPESLAEDDTPALPVIQHAVREYKKISKFKPNIILLLQPTSPFRTTEHIDAALDIFVNSDADSIVSVTQVPHSYNPFSIMELKGGYLEPYCKYSEKNNLRQLKPTFYARNGAAIYACTYECLFEKNSLYGEKIMPFFMKKEESLDLDDMWDWRIAELILKSRDK